ncbi:MAG TPA: MBL fold metallo-hydrolase, partial [Actinomycetota bacterium]|nr:MBL fold metallo-hydrolase [Actinomycetota bacterium]
MNRRSAAALTLVAALIAVVVPLDRAAAGQSIVAARRAVFGAANVADDGRVRGDRVILSWFGVTNFAAAIGGHVVLLDAWVPRGEYSGYVPASPETLAAIKPEYIFAGHSHFDHLADAAEIAVASGAKLVGTPEHCDQVRRQAGMAPVVCVEAVARGAARDRLHA